MRIGLSRDVDSRVLRDADDEEDEALSLPLSSPPSRSDFLELGENTSPGGGDLDETGPSPVESSTFEVIMTFR